MYSSFRSNFFSNLASNSYPENYFAVMIFLVLMLFNFFVRTGQERTPCICSKIRFIYTKIKEIMLAWLL